MITRTKKLILKYVRYYYWKYSDDLVWVILLLVVGYVLHLAYPVDPNALV